MIAERNTFHRVMDEIRRLSMREQLELIDEITALLRGALPSQPSRSILELEGLGAHLWRGLRAQEYVSQERAA